MKLEKIKLNDKAYTVLKWLVLLALPATSTLYSVLAGIWNLPYGEQIPQTLTAVATFLGAIIGVSTVAYNKTKSKNQ